MFAESGALSVFFGCSQEKTKLFDFNLRFWESLLLPLMFRVYNEWFYKKMVMQFWHKNAVFKPRS
jgi:hypothetical protein